jgi:hypothetical protein
VRRFCRDAWGNQWWDCSEQVQEARKRVAIDSLGGAPADEASRALVGNVDQARVATQTAASAAAASAAARDARKTDEAELEASRDAERQRQYDAGGAEAVAEAGFALIVAEAQHSCKRATAAERDAQRDCARIAIHVTHDGEQPITVFAVAKGSSLQFHRAKGKAGLKDCPRAFPWAEDCIADLLSAEG